MVRTISKIALIALVGFMATLQSVDAEAQDNLLKNPSFEAVDEKGLPAEWSLSKRVLPGKKGEPTLKVGAPAHDGERAAQLSFGPALEWAYVTQTQWKLLAPEEKYSFSVSLRADKPGRASIVLFVLGKPTKKGEKLLEMQRREWMDLTTEWKRYSAGATIDNAGQYARLWCVVQLHTAGVTLSIDDARLVHENPAASAGVSETSLHPTHSVGCVRTDTPPVIDGKLDDACWERAGVAGRFLNTANIAEPRPGQQTKVYLLHDERNLYVAYRCYEAELDLIKAEKTERDADGLWGDDCVELFLMPPDSSYPGIAIVGPKYYYLLVNSLGTQGDNVGLTKVDQWDPKWLARTAREDDAWTVEMKIPFREVSSRPREGAPWRVNFTRSQKRLGENSSWSPLDLKFHDPPRFGNMFFVNEPGDAALVVAAAVATQAEKISGKWREALSESDAAIERVLPLVSGTSREGAAGLAQELKRARRRIKDLLRRLAAMKPQEMVDQKDALNDRVETALGKADPLVNAADALVRAEDNGVLVVRSTPTITNDRVLPVSLVAGEAPAKALSCSACPGEYESVSFTVTPSRDVEGLTITCSDLTSSDGVIDASAIDVKLVKCWYQAFGEPWTGGVSFQRGKVLLPELLVNDDDLVRVDLKKKRNLLRVADPKTGEERYEDVTGENEALTPELVIRDAPSLLPVDIPAGQVRQFWVTAHVREDAEAGAYEGKIVVACEGSGEVSLPLRLEVHPFKLAPSAVEQSIFYRGQLTGSEVPVIDAGNKKTEAQYEVELRDMVAHGVDAPLVYQPPGDMDLMKRALEMRQEADVRTDRFFFCAWGHGPNDKPESTRRVLGEMMALTRSLGYREFYNYGPDEPSAERVRQQIAPWKFLREDIGAKVYLACNSFTDSTGALREDLWNQVKGVVNAFVVGGKPNPELAAVMHEAGLRIYNYANPQCGIEEPETYRRNYGLLLWKAGYDGAMDYAYQHAFGEHMWNDFDSGDLSHPYRDHVMAYATSDGVVGTLQWEGYREGVDDLRYLSTLLAEVEKAKKDAQRASQADEIEEWIGSIDVGSDLDEIRAEIVERILRLAP